MQEVVVELIRVSKKYGRRQLFADINQLICPGECIGVTGPNGSGKSTLIKVIAGLLRPSTGEVNVRMAGKELAADQRMSCFGLISPELIFYNAMTGYENLKFLARARGWELSDEQLQNCLETVGLNGRRHERISTYSTGMRQRLKFALLEALRPPVWLLDEPSSNLDEEGKQLVKRLVDKALARQTAVVIATNDLEEVRDARQKIALA
ncbi:ABC transporter ATP-binding protein [Sporomusa acidovorans]|uniref:ABC transporter ATP-binding protein NosF n=1 Tax=Sporomusa acidovorans (strain ATCC 49682 / DSM 3132 / Mol) TaxID=1123286 RepID=A0ABZ3J9N4_SPOA4|nr:ABC transporter ATP-binding protein [Sporomusa acidovorans]OZC21788.1 putative ABC transporter ATP-binding protein YxlF [Sporomusa acidovorans DSM 3132]SDD56850.1 heme exporter protein A [Sporomusa acidovorans]